ncbi:MAG: hypothetical protein ACT4PT_14020 [Methanobacteriota archaeon]
MPAAIFCPKCDKKLRGENHLCQPTALVWAKRRRDARAPKPEAKK